MPRAAPFIAQDPTLSSSMTWQENSSSQPLCSSCSRTKSPMLMCRRPVASATSPDSVVFPVPGVPVMRMLGAPRCAAMHPASGRSEERRGPAGQGRVRKTAAHGRAARFRARNARVQCRYMQAH